MIIRLVTLKSIPDFVVDALFSRLVSSVFQTLSITPTFVSRRVDVSPFTFDVGLILEDHEELTMTAIYGSLSPHLLSRLRVGDSCRVQILKLKLEGQIARVKKSYE